MNRIFVEASWFKDVVDEISQHDPEILKTIQSEILKNPEAGDVVQGTGCVRKIRIADKHRRKGKRGGYRVLYFDLEEKKKTYLIWIYSKGEREDISPDGRRIIKELIGNLKLEDSK